MHAPAASDLQLTTETCPPWLPSPPEPPTATPRLRGSDAAPPPPVAFESVNDPAKLNPPRPPPPPMLFAVMPADCSADVVIVPELDTETLSAKLPAPPAPPTATAI